MNTIEKAGVAALSAVALVTGTLVAPQKGITVSSSVRGKAIEKALGRDTITCTGKQIVACVVIDNKVVLMDTMTAPNDGKQVLHTKYTIVKSK